MEIGEATRRRGAHRSSASRLINQAREMLQSESPDLGELKCLRKKLEDKKEVLVSLDDIIVSLLGEDADLEAEIENADAKNLEIDIVIEKNL